MGGNATQLAKVDATIVEWCHHTNITFKRVDSAGQIRITFDPYTGSWSYVGKRNLDVDPTKPTMNLGWVDGTSASATGTDTGTILHEFGHALGLSHESLSSAKGGTTLDATGRFSHSGPIWIALSYLDLTRLLATTQFYFQTHGISAATVKESILDVYAAGGVSNFVEVDQSSIMLSVGSPTIWRCICLTLE